MRYLALAALVALPVAYVVAPTLVEASENRIGANVASDPNDGGVGIRSFGPLPPQFSNLTMQCLNVDVYVRAGCDAGCIVDAGPGDIFVSFNSSNDSYPFPLDRNSNQDRVLFQNVDGGAASCNFYRVLP